MVMTLWMRMWMILLNAMTMFIMVVVEYAGGVPMTNNLSSAPAGHHDDDY